METDNNKIERKPGFYHVKFTANEEWETAKYTERGWMVLGIDGQDFTDGLFTEIDERPITRIEKPTVEDGPKADTVEGLKSYLMQFIDERIAICDKGEVACPEGWKAVKLICESVKSELVFLQSVIHAIEPLPESKPIEDKLSATDIDFEAILKRHVTHHLGIVDEGDWNEVMTGNNDEGGFMRACLDAMKEVSGLEDKPENNDPVAIQFVNWGIRMGWFKLVDDTNTIEALYNMALSKHSGYKPIVEDKGIEKPESETICACTVSDKPCSPHCSCKHPYHSGGCLNCATYGSAEQRKSMAENIQLRLIAPTERKESGI